MRDRTLSYIIILLVVLAVSLAYLFSLSGCAPAITKACKELTKAHKFLSDAELVALAGHERDPNVITEDHLIQLEEMLECVRSIRDMTCGLKDIIPEK